MNPQLLHFGPQQFNARWATTNGDGSLGNGTFNGTFWLFGKVLWAELVLLWGTTSVLGTGNLLLPLPLTYTADDIDLGAMPAAVFGQSIMTAVALESLGGMFSSAPVSVNASAGPPQVAVIGNLIGGLALIAPNDLLVMNYKVPLRQRALPVVTTPQVQS